MSVFENKTLLITGGTGSFGNAVLRRFLTSDIKEIRIFSRDEKKQDDMRHHLQAAYPEVAHKVKFYIGNVRNRESVKIDDLARRMISLAGFKPDVDIKIEYSGLRPGEKLYEEVLSNNENTMPTDHSRIRIAKVRDYDYNEARAGVEELERLSREVEIPSMVKLMKDIVPEFISKNSRFEAYDSPSITLKELP